MELRPVSAEEEPAFTRACQAAFHDDPHVDDRALTTALFEPARSLAVLDDGAIVATTSAYTRELSVPGAVVDAACVTEVGVLPTHRRRGLLTQLMRRQLDDVHERGEPIAGLWASEPGIYGRFGYGAAARAADLSVVTAGARGRDDPPAAPGRIVLLAPDEAVARVAPLYDALRRARVGHVSRNDAWWTRRWRRGGRRGAGPRAARALAGRDGRAVGLPRRPGPHAARDLGARAARRAAGLVPHAARTPAGTADREPVGAGRRRRRALSRRTYAAPVDVVLDLDDGFCPWNSGRWRLSADATGATGARTGAPADLALSAIDLGAVYLGGPTLAALAAAGRVREPRAGALAATSLAFAGARAPWCPEVF